MIYEDGRLSTARRSDIQNQLALVHMNHISRKHRHGLYTTININDIYLLGLCVIFCLRRRRFYARQHMLYVQLWTCA